MEFDLQTLYILHSFAAAAISAALAVFLAPRWNAPGARALLLLIASVAVWSLCYGMEFKSATLDDKLWWVHAEYLGAVWAGLFYFRFAMVLTGKVSWLRGARSWLFFIIPVLTLVAVYTNGHHGLIWSRVWIEEGGPIPALVYSRGVGFWVFVVYSYGLLLAGTALLFYGYLFSRHIDNRDFWLILIGIMAPWTTNILYLMEFEPIRHIDLTPAAFAVSGITFFWGTIRHQMLELIPIARDAVIESMQDAVFVLDLQHRVIDLNTAARQVLPDAPGGIAGKALSALFPQLFSLLVQLRSSGTDEAEIPMTTGGAARIWRMRSSQLVNIHQMPCGWLITLQDISMQRRHENALRESEEKFRSISANALDGILMIDPSGRVSFWNKAAEQIFGYHENEILGKDLHAYLAPDRFHDHFQEAFSSFRQTGEGPMLGKTIEIECLRKNGDVFPAELSLSPLELNNQWHAVGIVRDITERRKTQEYLIQTEKMISLGGLAAGMAHEINNPLAGILANIQVMRMRLLSDLPANLSAAEACGLDVRRMQAYMGSRGILDMIEAIDQSCQRAATIVRNMLAFSRKSDTVFSGHHLADLLEQTLELAGNDFHLKDHYDFRKIVMVKAYARNLPPVSCDAAQIQQVLLNILKNGAQAMRETADHSRPATFTLKVYADRYHGCIAITDNGPGMPEEIRKRIFEPFYTTKSVGSGTGLGLSIAYFIITENHNGTLDVSSTPGEGTTFTLRLPLTQAP